MPAESRWATWVAGLLLIVVVGCTGVKPASPYKIVLMAPFEGAERAIGYNALYAARLALADYQRTTGHLNVELLAVDAGEDPFIHRLRIRALLEDPSIHRIIGLGGWTTEEEVMEGLQALNPIVVGYWGEPIHSEKVVWLSADISVITQESSVTDEIGIPMWNAENAILREQVIVTSGSVADTEFRERYLLSDRFAPEPDWLAMLVYDAIGLALQVNDDDLTSRIAYVGNYYTFNIEKGNWLNAPLNQFQLDLD